MTQNKNQNIIYLDANNLYGYVMPKFLPTNGTKYTSISSKGFVLEVDLEYPK